MFPSNGAAIFLSWREIFCALPSLASFSAASINRARSLARTASVSSARSGGAVPRASTTWLAISVLTSPPAAGGAETFNLAAILSSSKGVTERSATTSRRTCSMASSFSLNTSKMSRTLPSCRATQTSQVSTATRRAVTDSNRCPGEFTSCRTTVSQLSHDSNVSSRHDRALR